jgi:hypothetical protein
MATRTRLATTLALAIACSGAFAAEDRLTILDEGDIGNFWRPMDETMAMPAYPGIVADKTEDVCVSVGYLLKEDGSTSDFAVLKAWGSKAEKAKPTDPHFLPFSQNALAAVQRWRFQSAGGAKIRPIYTAATFAFSTSGADPAGLKARCRIDDLRQFITEAQAKASRDNITRGRLERQRVQNPDTIQPRQGSTLNP